MGVFRQFPYTNFHEMNMDEIIKIVKNMLEEWARYYETWDNWKEQVTQEWAEMQSFINNYFDNLDVQNEINTKINNMVASGEFGAIVSPYIPPSVSDWLATHITQPVGVVIDTSLSVSGACADAKATGDAINELGNNFYKSLAYDGQMPLIFENGGLYTSTGLEYISPNIRTKFMPVIVSDSDIIVINNGKAGNVFEYDANKTFITKTSFAASNSNKRISLNANTAFIRITIGCDPSDISQGDGVRLYFENNILTKEQQSIMALAHGGLVNSFYVSPTITAYLFKDGTFAVYGEGTAPAYSYSDKPLWIQNGYLDMIKDFYFDNRITFSTIGYWFANYSSVANPIYGNSRIEKTIDVPSSVTALYGGTFGQYDFRHINLYHVQSLTDWTLLPAPCRNRHCIVSIPERICNDTLITAIVNRIEAQYTFTPHENADVIVFITDSSDLHQAIMDSIWSIRDATPHMNITCILCNELGADGFPLYWNERMKTCLKEIIPYFGRQLAVRRIEEDGEYRYPVTGLTSLSTYTGYGWINESDFDTTADLCVDNEEIPSGDGSHVVSRQLYKKYTVGTDHWLGAYNGQPFSTSLDNLARGLSCSGFVNFIFWRYFNENFGLPASVELNLKKGKYGNPLPLTEITIDDLQPFDIINMAIDLDGSGTIDDNDDGGHDAIFLGYYTDENDNTYLQVMQCNMGSGLVFGLWAFDDEWYTEHGQINTNKFYRLDTTSNGMRHNVISRESI